MPKSKKVTNENGYPILRDNNNANLYKDISNGGKTPDGKLNS